MNKCEIISPIKTFTIVFLISGFSLFVFKSNIYVSNLIENIPLPLNGYLHYMFFVFLMLTSITIYTKIKKIKVPVIVLPSGSMAIIICLFTVLGLTGLIRYDGLNVFNLSYLYNKIVLRDTNYSYIQGRNVIGMWLFSYFACMLSLLNLNKTKAIVVIVNLIICTLYATIFKARVFIVYPILSCFVIWLKMGICRIKKSTVLIGIIGVIFLIMLGGLRDYKVFGYRYSTNFFDWSIRQAFEYVLSPTLFTIRIAGESYENIKSPRDMSGDNIFSKRMEFHKNTPLMIGGVYGYNNIGILGNIYSYFGLFYIVVIMLYTAYISIVWRLYMKGSYYGMLNYPILFISIFESYRFFFLLLEIGFFAIFMGAFIGLITDKKVTIQNYD